IAWPRLGTRAGQGEPPDPAPGRPPGRLYTIGNTRPAELPGFGAALEAAIGRPAIRELAAMQPGDVVATFADVADLQEAVDFKPDTPIEEGLRRFVEWYRTYKNV